MVEMAGNTYFEPDLAEAAFSTAITADPTGRMLFPPREADLYDRHHRYPVRPIGGADTRGRSAGRESAGDRIRRLSFEKKNTGKRGDTLVTPEEFAEA